MMNFKFEFDDNFLMKGINILKHYFEFEEGIDVIVTSEKISQGLKVEKRKNQVKIQYENISLFFMGFSYLIQNYNKEYFEITRSSVIKNLGIMRDCARNATLNKKGFQDLIVYMSLMGYTYLELYLEDLMKIKELKYLGHSRPAFASETIKEFDEFAKIFGIELIPSIQTLAHLPLIFRYDEFSDINDNGAILLVGEEKTYKFIDTILNWVCNAFSSKQINIGMDEAHTLGIGKYTDKFGYPENKGKIFLEHLNRVIELCKKYNLKPSIWSDMFFRLGMNNENSSSYVGIEGKHFSEDFKSNVPKDIQLIFWDYNHSNEDFYNGVILQHNELSKNIAVACGAWTWKGYVPFNTIAEKNSLVALRSCKLNEINNFLVTVWGDNGAECSTFMAISTFLAISEEAYGEWDLDFLNERCLFLFGNTYEEFKNLENINITREGTIKDGKDINPSKYLLYNDILLGIFDAHAYPELKQSYQKSKNEMFRYKKREGRFAYLFDTLYKLARCLEIKSVLGLELTKSYRENNFKDLQIIATKKIPICIKYMKGFYEAIKEQWEKENSSFGFEIIDIRLGSMMFRLKEVSKTILDYINGKIKNIEELEQERLPISIKKKKGEDIVNNCYAVQISGSLL